MRGGSLPEAFDATVRQEIDRMFPGISAERHEQATFAARNGGLGWRRASDTARPANLSSLVMAAPKVRAMAAAAVHAGLLREAKIEGLLDEKLRLLEAAYLSQLV